MAVAQGRRWQLGSDLTGSFLLFERLGGVHFRLSE